MSSGAAALASVCAYPEVRKLQKRTVHYSLHTLLTVEIHRHDSIRSSITLQESANAVRSIVGGIELLMTLLACMDLTKCKVSHGEIFSVN